MAGCLHSLLPDGRDGSTQKGGMCSVKIASTFGRLESWLPHGARWVMGNSAAPVSVKTETERSSKVCSYGAETTQNGRISFETDFRKWLIQPFHKPISITLWANNHCDPIWYNLSANQGRKWPAAKWRLLKIRHNLTCWRYLGNKLSYCSPCEAGRKTLPVNITKITLTVALNDVEVFLGCDFWFNNQTFKILSRFTVYPK